MKSKSIIAALIGCIMSGGAQGQAPLQNCADQFHLFGLESLVLGDRVFVSAVLVGSDGKAELGADSRVNGNMLAANSLFMRERSILNGALYLSGSLQRQNSTVITGKTLSPDNLPGCLAPLLPAANPGAGRLEAQSDLTLDLDPGRYGNVVIFPRGTLVVTSGEYHFETLQFEADSRLVVLWSGAPAVLVTKTALRLGDRHSQAIIGSPGGGGQALWFMAHQQSGIRIGPDSHVVGRLIAPNAEVNVSSRNGMDGPIYSRRIRIEPDVRIGPDVQLTLCR